MIIDRVDKIMFYEKLLPNLANAMRKAEELGEHPKIGRYEFEGGFLMVQEGETVPMTEGSYEAHRRYIDVQILTEGCEEVAWEEISRLTVSTPYSEEKDCELLDGDRAHSMLISEGMFYAAFPSDAHRPIAHTENQHRYRKLVIKLPVE
ncbi:MAG: YhcH/YjgK/YiaL family protein [Eubacteriales bacterium]|nr:YhcH/YjgK/YiaL family protein [Eubacteriales bacterium]